jgi:hypothetical protein
MLSVKAAEDPKSALLALWPRLQSLARLRHLWFGLVMVVVLREDVFQPPIDHTIREQTEAGVAGSNAATPTMILRGVWHFS